MALGIPCSHPSRGHLSSLLPSLHCHACSVWAAAPTAALTHNLSARASARSSTALIPLPGARWVTRAPEDGSTGSASARNQHHTCQDSLRGGVGTLRQDESGPSLGRGPSARYRLPPTNGRVLWGIGHTSASHQMVTDGLGCVRCKHPSVRSRQIAEVPPPRVLSWSAVGVLRPIASCSAMWWTGGQTDGESVAGRPTPGVV